MRDAISGQTRTMEFDSMADLAAAAAKYANAEQRNSDHTTEWAGASFDETLRMAREGWTDELASAMEIAESAVTMAEQEHTVDSFNQPVWDVTGATVDVGAYLAGTPECMVDYPLSETSKVGRVITLVVSSIVSSSISTDTLIRRGRVITALALALAKLGHAVEIWVDSYGTKNTKTLIQRVLVKGVNDEIDPAILMFALGHPAMHRQLVIGTRGVFTGTWEKTFRMGARPTQRSESFKATYPEGTIFLPELKSDNDIPDADMFLRRYLGELGLLAE